MEDSLIEKILEEDKWDNTDRFLEYIDDSTILAKFFLFHFFYTDVYRR